MSQGKIFLIFLFIIFTWESLNAQNVDTIYATYRYIMGDNDTKTDAKRICFLEAKRQCLEKAGTYIESNVTVENYQVTEDEIKTYSASILKVDIVSEKTEVIGESFAIVTTVKAEVDLDFLREQIEKIKSDDDVASEVQQQEQQRTNIEKKIQYLHKELAKADEMRVQQIRKEMSQAFADMDSLERFKDLVRTKTKLALENLRLGMTPEQVIRVLGKPLKKVQHHGNPRLNYGLVWVVFSNGKASCLVKAKQFKPHLNCRDYPAHQKMPRR